MTNAELATLVFRIAVVFVVACFACYMVGFYRGERLAGKNYRVLQRANSGSVISRSDIEHIY